MEQMEFETEERDRGYNKYIVTLLLGVVNILIFIYTYLVPGDYYLTGGTNYQCIVENKEYYRIFTSMFLHGDIKHIAMNMLALFTAGSLVESYLGSFKTSIIYFSSGLGGSILSLLIPENEIMSFSIGASGAIFGLLVASAILQNKKAGKSMVGAIGFVIVYAVLTWSDGIDLTGHICGAVAGAVATLLCSIRFDEHYIEGKAGICIGILLTLIISLVAVIYIL